MDDYTERTIKTITVTLTTNGKHITADFYEPESGDSSRVIARYSPDEHREFNDRVGNELYWWVNDYMDTHANELEEE